MAKSKVARTVKLNLYEYKNLPTEEAKERARQWMIDLDNNCFDADDFTENVLQQAAEYDHGVKTDKCFWALSYCQGDGVGFYGNLDMDVLKAKDEDIAGLILALKMIHYYVSSCTIPVPRGNYSGPGTMYPEVLIERDEAYEENETLDEGAASIAEKMQDYIKEILDDAARAVADIGYRELEYRQSEEYLSEEAEGNDWLFDEDGEHFDEGKYAKQAA